MQTLSLYSHLKIATIAILFTFSFNNMYAQDVAMNGQVTEDLYASNETLKPVAIESDSIKNATKEAEPVAAAPEKKTAAASKSVLSIARIEGFNAFGADRFIRLNWTTTSERNCEKLILERRGDSERDYVEVDYIMGRGTTYEKGNFYLMDYEAESGKRYYYRLKMINEAGEYQYSKVVSGSK